jgi:hypothetical protein
MYSMTNLVEFEPYVDRTIDFFLGQLEKLQGGKTCDLGLWLHYFAFDVMGEITFSKRLGFLDEVRDIEGIIANTAKVSRYAAVVSLFLMSGYPARVQPDADTGDSGWANAMDRPALGQEPRRSVLDT